MFSPTLTHKPSKQIGGPRTETEFLGSSMFHDGKWQEIVVPWPVLFISHEGLACV